MSDLPQPQVIVHDGTTTTLLLEASSRTEQSHSHSHNEHWKSTIRPALRKLLTARKANIESSGLSQTTASSELEGRRVELDCTITEYDILVENLQRVFRDVKKSNIGSAQDEAYRDLVDDPSLSKLDLSVPEVLRSLARFAVYPTAEVIVDYQSVIQPRKQEFIQRRGRVSKAKGLSRAVELDTLIDFYTFLGYYHTVSKQDMTVSDGSGGDDVSGGVLCTLEDLREVRQIMASRQ